MADPALPDLQTTTIDGRKLAWREAGRGPSVVLVHGIGGQSRSWRHQLADFRDTFRTIAWDAPGYGGSDPAPAPIVDAYAGALAALLGHLGVREPHLVGHSLGSIMIASACRDHGITPASLTFLQPVTGSGTLPDDERERIRQARIADMRKLGPAEFATQRGRLILSKQATPRAVDEAMEVMRAVPEAGYLTAWDMMCNADLFALLEQRRPTLVICGSDDPVCPPASARTIADAVDGAVYHCLDGVGHYAAIEAPQRLNVLLRGFFGGRA
jgi:pimeloyl-ACP methyl ester carboxylesterase